LYNFNLILYIPLTCTFVRVLSRSKEIPEMLAVAKQSGDVPTLDRPSLELSTHVKVPESEEATPEDDPS
jgi:hypothetical protein